MKPFLVLFPLLILWLVGCSKGPTNAASPDISRPPQARLSVVSASEPSNELMIAGTAVGIDVRSMRKAPEDVARIEVTKLGVKVRGSIALFSRYFFKFVPLVGQLEGTYTVRVSFRDGTRTAASVNIPPHGGPLVRLASSAFARGPGQRVDIPVSGEGIPLVLVNPKANSTADIVVRMSLPASLVFRGVSVLNYKPGTEVIAYENGNQQVSIRFRQVIADTKNITLGSVNLSVAPGYEGYGITSLVQMSATMNGSVLLAQPGVHLNAFLGDANANRRYDRGDRDALAALAVGTLSSLVAYPFSDFSTVSDITGNGTVSSADASRLSSLLALAPEGSVRPETAIFGSWPSEFPQFVFRGDESNPEQVDYCNKKLPFPILEVWNTNQIVRPETTGYLWQPRLARPGQTPQEPIATRLWAKAYYTAHAPLLSSYEERDLYCPVKPPGLPTIKLRLGFVGTSFVYKEPSHKSSQWYEVLSARKSVGDPCAEGEVFPSKPLPIACDIQCTIKLEDNSKVDEAKNKFKELSETAVKTGQYAFGGRGIPKGSGILPTGQVVAGVEAKPYCDHRYRETTALERTRFSTMMQQWMTDSIAGGEAWNADLYIEDVFRRDLFEFRPAFGELAYWGSFLREGETGQLVCKNGKFALNVPMCSDRNDLRAIAESRCQNYRLEYKPMCTEMVGTIGSFPPDDSGHLPDPTPDPEDDTPPEPLGTPDPAPVSCTSYVGFNVWAAAASERGYSVQPLNPSPGAPYVLKSRTTATTLPLVPVTASQLSPIVSQILGFTPTMRYSLKDTFHSYVSSSVGASQAMGAFAATISQNIAYILPSAQNVVWTNGIAPVADETGAGYFCDRTEPVILGCPYGNDDSCNPGVVVVALPPPT